MNQISGKVLLKETNVGIPDLLVEIYDVDSAIRPEELIFGDGATGVSVAPPIPSVVSQAKLLSLGSVPTDGDGRFKLEYEDSEFRWRNPEEKRPDLLLVVRAPEEMDGPRDAGILHISKTRQDASSRESYIIRTPTQKLVAAGLSAPSNLALDEEEPETVIQKVRLSVSRQARIKQEVQKIAAEQVATERARVAKVEKQVEKRLIEKLTGVPDRLAERLNYVRPGEDVEAAMFSAIKKSIEGTINQAPPAKGYLVLSETQAEGFKKDGKFREDITPEELEPLLFGSADNDKRPTFFIRESPINLTQPPPLLIEGSGNNGGPGTDPRLAAPSDGAAHGSNSLAAISPENIPDFVERLIKTMTSPEEAVAFGVKPRSTQETIDNDIGDFLLRSGPADVPAFYDFHSLHIAFDWVWQKAIDEGVIEGAKVLGRQLLDMGGDPLGALRNGADPIKALREELRIVQSAHASRDVIPSRLRNQKKKLDEDGGPGPDPDVELPPQPPIAHGGTHPGTNGTDTVIDPGREKFPHELLSQIESLLNERFAFEIFAPGSVNFGFMVTYRQRWAPINYQAGDLVKTLTLAPKETRKISVKRVVKKDRSVKEMENSLRIRKEDSSDTARHEAEIVAKAEAKTNFSLTAQGSYNIGIAKGDSTTVIGRDASTNSSDTKKAFREAVLKASQEYKDERKLEVETKESYEQEVSESSEITNPNDELAVTYLFYELQRRYKVSEQIHRLTPVVLVAMDVPSPSRRSIDALLLTYGWVIDRVLLDDQFRKPLEYFRTKMVGEEFALTTMVQNLVVMRGVVDELKRSYTQARNKTNTLADLLNAQIVAKAQATDAQESEGFWEKAVETFTGDDDDVSIEAARILEDAARERLERAVNQERELRTQLDSETAALKSANDAYSKALAEYLNCAMDVGTLRLHIKENILYYMQAIWSHTFQDQLFLALHKKTVPLPKSNQKSYSLSQPATPPASVPAKAGQIVVEVSAKAQLESELDPVKDSATLAEVADLDNLLGFKGNYLIFPLRQSNALTDFMMTPFVDSELGLRDPDEFGNFTPEEFIAHARDLHAEMKRQLERGEITQEELAVAVERLSDQFRRLLSAPRRAEDEIIIPTGSLFIEALPAAHPILEDFKLMHRAVDVKKVQAEVRKLEMENIRYATRILKGEHEDPDIEKKIIVEGGSQSIIVPPVEG
jgi:hypothetical protein